MNSLDPNSLFEAVTSANPKESPVAPDELIKYRIWKSSEEYGKVGYESRINREREFFQQPFIQEYLEAKWQVEIHNKSSIEWLVDFKNNYMTEAQSHAVDFKLRQFLKVLGDQKTIFQSLRIDLRKLGLAEML